MRHAIIGSFAGVLLAAAVLAACGGSGAGSDPAVDELVLKVAALEQEVAQLQADLQTQAGEQSAHESDPSAHHVPTEALASAGTADVDWLLQRLGVEGVL